MEDKIVEIINKSAGILYRAEQLVEELIKLKVGNSSYKKDEAKSLDSKMADISKEISEELTKTIKLKYDELSRVKTLQEVSLIEDKFSIAEKFINKFSKIDSYFVSIFTKIYFDEAKLNPLKLDELGLASIIKPRNDGGGLN